LAQRNDQDWHYRHRRNAFGAHWKYIIAHEIGHHAQDAAMGYMHYYYSDEASESLCTCSYDLDWGNVEHCMQSREFSGGAQLEGFAQTFASRVFNLPSQSDAVHVYYKPFAEHDWMDPEWPPEATFDVLDAPQWRNSECPATNKGVEMDWMTFFYALTMEYTSDSVPMNDIFEVYRTACGSGTPVKCSNVILNWSSLDFGASEVWAWNPDAYNYWLAMSAAHGVSN
jgi:hypothetical protein